MPACSRRSKPRWQPKRKCVPHHHCNLCQSMPSSNLLVLTESSADRESFPAPSASCGGPIPQATTGLNARSTASCHWPSTFTPGSPLKCFAVCRRRPGRTDQWSCLDVGGGLRPRRGCSGRGRPPQGTLEGAVSDQPGLVSVKHPCTSSGMRMGRDAVSMPECVLPCDGTRPLQASALGPMYFLLSRVSSCQVSEVESSAVAAQKIAGRISM